MDILLYAELAINGALVGLMYALVALGIVLVYKASGYANLAQGAFAMTGGYACLLITTALGVPMWAAALLSLVVLFFAGVLVERFLLRRMIEQPVVMVIMLTLGLEILLRGLVPGLLGSTVKRLDLGISQAPVLLGDILVNRAYLTGGVIALVLIFGAMAFFNSPLGVRMRAVSDDKIAAWSVGIRVEHVIAVAWGLAGVSAGAAGILWGSVQGVDWTLSCRCFCSRRSPLRSSAGSTACAACWLRASSSALRKASRPACWTRSWAEARATSSLRSSSC